MRSSSSSVEVNSNRSAGAAGGRLGTNTYLVQRNLRLTRRFAASRLSNWVFTTSGRRASFDRISFCGRPLVGDVPIVTDGVKCWPRGVASCGLGWVCAVCNAKIRSRRASDLQRVCDAHVAAGGRLSMLTLTVRHDRSMSLDSVMGAVANSWRKVQRRKSWSAGLRKVLVGQVVAPEVTVGVNGWHPHLHLLLFAAPGVSEVELNGLLPSFTQDWIQLAGEALGVSPSVDVGVNLVHFGVDSAAAASGYVSKVAKELTAGDMKSGRDPLALLDSVGDGDASAVAQFLEYAQVMRGRQSLTYSKGLKSRYPVVELTDEEIAARDEALGVEVCVVPALEWVAFLEAGSLDVILEHLEAHFCRPGLLSSA